MKDILRLKRNYYCCHPIASFINLGLEILLVLFAGAAALPLILFASVFSTGFIDGRINYMLPFTEEEILRSVRMRILFRTGVSGGLLSFSILVGKFQLILHNRPIYFSLWYLIPAVLLIFSLYTYTTVEQSEGVEAKHFASYNTKGIKKRTMLSVDGLLYMLSLISYIGLFILFSGVENNEKDITLVNDVNGLMIGVFTVSILCAVNASLLLRKMTIVDYHGTETPNMIADTGIGI